MLPKLAFIVLNLLIARVLTITFATLNLCLLFLSCTSWPPCTVALSWSLTHIYRRRNHATKLTPPLFIRDISAQSSLIARIFGLGYNTFHWMISGFKWYCVKLRKKSKLCIRFSQPQDFANGPDLIAQRRNRPAKLPWNPITTIPEYGPTDITLEIYCFEMATLSQTTMILSKFPFIPYIFIMAPGEIFGHLG